jgi:FixJ family two-component response regulator
MTDDPSGCLIAVVDDDQRILESLESLLESVGYSVRLFASASALLESASLADLDCLISDIDLPGMDGYELSRVVHASRPSLPVILMTGHPEILNRAPHTHANVFRVFEKPFDGHDLLTAVSEALASVAPRTLRP